MLIFVVIRGSNGKVKKKAYSSTVFFGKKMAIKFKKKMFFFHVSGNIFMIFFKFHITKNFEKIILLG